jgi:hypothetical protein
MRRALLLALTASIGTCLACSDRLPTSPGVGTKAGSTESAESPAATPARRPRQTIVVAPRTGEPVQGVWGSDTASLRVKEGGGTLDILALTLPTGSCFGTYGEIAQPIPRGRFTLAGTYTQLMGVYPGRVDYPAQFSGSVEGNTMTITIAVPSQQQSFGPFVLTYGVNNAWTPCLYP